MKNQNVISTIKNRYAQFKLEKANVETLQFTKDDVSINEDGILIDDIPVCVDAQKRFLSRMKVKNEFIGLASKASTTDWLIISNHLKNELKDRPYYAKIRRNETGDEVYSIIDYPIYEKTELLSNDKSIDSICKELEYSNDSYKLFSAEFDKKSNTIIIGLINEDTKFSIFEKASNDVWMSGVQFKFTETSFSSRHLLERLMCSNGMTTKEECFVTNINKKNFNQESIDKTISLVFQDPYKEIHKKISEQALVLKDNEISINEFYNFTRPLKKEAKKLKMTNELNDIFDDGIFFKEYGLDIKEKSNKWKSSANAGINAYDFFNSLTYVATHLFGEIDPGISTNLQLNASNFFFKRNFDISEIAPQLDFKFETNHIAFK